MGEIGKGFGAALYGVSLGRIYNSARSVGYGRWALEAARKDAAQELAAARTEAAGALVAPAAPQAVSYTHLRAHET